MASNNDDGRPPTRPRPPPPRARPQIRPIGDKPVPPVPRALRSPISLPSASVRIAQKPVGGLPAERPMPRFPSLPAIEADDDATRTQAPPELFQEPPPPRRMPAQTIRGTPPPPTRAAALAKAALAPGPAASPAPIPDAKPAPAPAPLRSAPAARIAAPAPRIAAPTPIPPRMSAPTPIPPRMGPAPLPPTRTEARPPAARADARPARPAIDIVPQGQRDPAERTVLMPSAPGRPAAARVPPPAQSVRARFPAPREPRPETPTARPPAPSVPSLGDRIEPIAAAKPAPSNLPPANRSPFVHTRTVPSTTHETQALPNPPLVRQTRTDRPPRAASTAPPRLHPPSFPSPAGRAPSMAPPQLDPAGHEHRDETLAMARPWPTPPAPAVSHAPQMQQPMHVQHPMLMQVPMTPQALPIMAHPGFAPSQSAPVAYAPPAAMIAAAQRPWPFGLVLFAAPLALATAALAALALLF